MSLRFRTAAIALGASAMTAGLLALVALVLQVIGVAVGLVGGVSGILVPLAAVALVSGVALLTIGAEIPMAGVHLERVLARSVAGMSSLIALVAWAPDIHRPGELGRLQWALIASGVLGLATSRFTGNLAHDLARRWLPTLAGSRGRVNARVGVLREGGRGLFMRVAVGAENPQRTRPGALRAWEASLVGLIAIAYTVVQIRFLRVPDIGDQADYFNAASDFPDTILTHRHARIGLLFPVRSLQEIFGFSEIAYYAVPVLSGALFSVGTYLLGRLLFNRAVGIGAGTLVLLNPYMMRDSSHLLPDIPAAAMLTWAIVLIIYASRRFGRTTEPDWAIRLLLIGVGILLGWSYLTREFTVLFFPLVLVAFWAFRLRMRLIIYVAGAALAALFFEMLVAQLTWGNPLARFETVLGRRAGPAAEAQRRGPLDTLLLLPRLLLNDSVGPFFIALIVLVVVGVLLVRDRRSILLATWSLGMWVVFLLISHQSAFDVVNLVSGGDLSFASLRFQKLRYWSPIWPAITVGGLGGMLSLYQWSAGLDRQRGNGPTGHLYRASFTAGVGLAVILTALLTVGIGISQVQGWTSWWIADRSTHYSEFRVWLEEHGDKYENIWTDNYTARVLPIYTSDPIGRSVWQGDVERFSGGRHWLPADELRPGLMVLHSGSLGRADESARPPYAQDPPGSWIQIAEFGPLTLLEVTP